MIIRLIIFTAVITTSVGCQHARSFLHMDSNSPSPFMGLELSVDASDATNTKGDRTDIKTASVDASAIGSGRVDSTGSVTRNQNSSMRESFVSTSETVETSSNLRFSLPAVDLSSGSTDADEVDDIIGRFPGS